MSSPTPSPVRKIRPRRRVLLPYLILLLGLCFTLIVTHYFAKLADEQDQSRFQSSVQEINDRIKARIQTSITLLRAGTGLFAASDDVDATEFEHFVDQMELPKNYEGVQGLGFSLRFSREQLRQVVNDMHKAGFSSFKVWPEAPFRDEYNAILFLQPAINRNEVAIGFDMATEPVRRRAMNEARDTGNPTASGKVTLVQEPLDNRQQAGFLIYAPVYQKNAPLNTESERRQALLGFIYSPFRVDDFLNAILAGTHYDVDFEVYDTSEIRSDTRLRALSSAVANDEWHSHSMVQPLDVGNRTWTLIYKSKPSFETGSNRPFLPYTFTTGILLSLLFFAVTRAEVRARTRAELAASELRESEATIRNTLEQREAAEEALREGEERYRVLVENANDIVYMLSLDGRITSINKAAETITGYSTDELLSMNIKDLAAAGSKPVIEQMLETKNGNGTRTNFEITIHTKNGNLLTLEVSNRVISKGLVSIHGIARDISMRRRAEEALREADQRALSEYERLLERISGLAVALGTGRELNTIFGALGEFTRVSVPCDGFFVSLYDPIRDVRTACYAWADHKELDVSELPPMPITTSGPNSRAVRLAQVIITNDYMSATRGHPSVIVGPDDGLRPQSSMAIPMSVMGRIVGTIEVQSYKKDAYRRQHATAMEMAANLTAVAIENIRLLKLERAAKESAEESNRLKDEFLATVSHELRTPLTAILGWSRLLESGSLSGPAELQAIDTIWRNAKAQAQIIDDILDVSRIITGNLYMELHPVELAPIIENAVNVVRPTADAKGIKIECELDQVPAVVSGDANRLQQVVWNLLSNAVKFTHSGGRVNVNVSQQNSSVKVSVCDTGQGISREFLPYVFDRFRQADSTTTRQHGGLGLGLAIARHLIEIHGGTINAESDGAGRGATFTISLPALDSMTNQNELPTATSGRQIKAPMLLSGVCVLVVDDDEDTLQLMATALSSRQAKVVAVSSAGEAIRAIEINRPDVLVSDIAMPDEDGYGLIERIRTMEKDYANSIPAVAITAYAKDEDRERALSSGFQLYLAKPVELTELISVVAQAARREF